MLDLCIKYYEEGRKKGIDLNTMTKYDNLKILQEAIQKRDKKFYELGELESCIRYCNMWNR